MSTLLPAYFSKITGTGAYLPKAVVTNADLAQRVDTSDEWIVERTGIQQRHIAGKEETCTTMAIEAARNALKAANVSPNEVEMIVVATCTPDAVFPSTACMVQGALGVSSGIALDVQAACSGFIYALSVADNAIRLGTVKKALVVGSEVMSRGIDWQDRKTCILFGDGAGALVLEASSTPGILSISMGADGREKEILYWENRPDAFIHMQGNRVFKLAVHKLHDITEEAIHRQGFKASDIDWMVPHQANIRIIKATADKLGMSMEKVIVTLDKQGNTSGASIPLALNSGICDGRIKKDQLIILEAFGAGLTWGTALLRMT
jgi:3-oxoacyl-[acyl-carrier-protein] synthase III